MASISGGTVKFSGRKWCNYGDVPRMLPDRSSVFLRRSRQIYGDLMASISGGTVMFSA